MHELIKQILEKCNEFYSNGDFYTLTKEDVKVLDLELELDLDTESVTDEIYDLIYYAAKSKYPSDAFFKKLTSTNAGYGEEIIHTIPMGSMDELKEGDWEKWSKGHNKFVLSDKLDGCSIILTYENGTLKTAATRGRGFKGKDIMRHIPFIKSIKKTISFQDEFIVRGELIFPKSMIDSLIKEVQTSSGKIYKNGRNMIAGLLNSREASSYLANADFVAYWSSANQGNSFEILTEQGFKTAYNHTIYRNWKETDSAGNEIEKELLDNDLICMVKTRLEQSVYELDGIILTQLDHIESGFETGTINPKASRKFKLGIYNNIAESTVTGIHWQISRWGVFTPVLDIEPTKVSGCTVTNITGHNYKNVLNKHCGIGSKIKFCRAGLVIPHLLQVLTPSDNLNLPTIATKVEGVDLVLNEKDMSDELIEMWIQQLVYFGKKLEIEHLGYGNCKKLFSVCMLDNIIPTPDDFLMLPEGLITDIIGENGKKIEASLKSKKNSCSETKLAAAMGAFGDGLGETVLNLVYNKYNTLDVTKEQLNVLDGFGDKRIDQYLNHVEYWKKLKERILKYTGFTFKEKYVNNIYKDYVICFSGIRDKEFAKYIEENGGIATDSWKNSVTHLVVKDKNTLSSKIKKAQEKQIPILTLDEIKALLVRG